MATKTKPDASGSEKKLAKVDSTFTVLQSTSGKLAYKRKPSMNFNTLRAVRDADSIVNICVETLKHTIVKIPFSINVKGNKDVSLYEEEIRYAENLFKNPNPQESRRIMELKVLEDILTIDRGVVEYVYNAKGYIVQIWQVDGATIFPRYNEDRTGEFDDPAYVQLLNNLTTVEASFAEDELDVLMNSPQGNIGMTGFGKSPVERMINNIVTSIQSQSFNANIFNKNSLPPAVIGLENASSDEVKTFREAWETSVQNDLFKNVFTNRKLFLEKLRESNQDMQYYELSLWLAKLTIAAFEMSPQDLGLTMDINRATGEVQQNISKNQALRNILDLMSEWRNKVLLKLGDANPKFLDLECAYDELDKLDSKTQADIDQIYVNAGILLADEIRIRDGYEPLADVQSKMEGDNEDAAIDQEEGGDTTVDGEKEDGSSDTNLKKSREMEIWYKQPLKQNTAT